MAQHYCEKCGMMKDEKEFYSSRNLEKYPDGKLNQCKRCITLFVDNWDPETYTWILKEIDVPYIQEEWDGLLKKWGNNPEKLTGMTILGKYLSKMKLRQFNTFKWEDGPRLEEERRQTKIQQMKAQGFTGEEIEDALKNNKTPEKPKSLLPPGADPNLIPSDAFDDYSGEIEQQVTDEEKLQLKLKWGKAYRLDELVKLESHYKDMMDSYDIQGAGQKDTLIMICKASLRANQLIDTGDK